MNINTLLDSISEAIATDSDISTWCNANYSDGVSVYVNIDSRKPPRQDDCPLVLVYPVAKFCGQRENEKQHVFSIGCCVYDESRASHAGISNITEYAGVKNAEALRKYVETAIAGLTLTNCEISPVEVEYDPIESFPFIWALMTITIVEAVTIGSDPLL